MTHLLRSGTYGLGSLRERTAQTHVTVVGRLKYTLAERKARVAVLRESFLKSLATIFRDWQSVRDLMRRFPDAYETEIKQVVTALVADKILVSRKHGSRLFYRRKQ